MTQTARLRWLLVGFVAALALPGAYLLWYAYDQLRWQAFSNARETARGAAQTLEQVLTSQQQVLVEALESYRQATSGATADPTLQRLMLLAPVDTPSGDFGLLGFFQVDAAGGFSSPLLPAGVRPTDLPESEARQLRFAAIRSILSGSTLLQNAPASDRFRALAPGRSAKLQAAPAPEEQVLQDEPTAEAAEAAAAVDVIGTTASSPAAAAPPPAMRKQEGTRLEDLELDQIGLNRARRQDALASALVSLDERAVEAFRQPNSDVRFGRLSSGHFVLFQELWQPTGRLVQGALLEPEAFLRALKAPLASLPAEAAALVAYNGTLLGSEERAGRAAAGRQLLYQYRAPPPFAGLELAFVSDRLSLGRSARLLGWLGLALAAVLVGGAGLLYRLGLGQLRLAARQRDFVAAVSHELKTPLTSIRMYGEMLASGLAAPERRDRYYRYILDESERLSRLIENVLQLARFERGESTLELAPVTVGDLFKQVRDRVAEPVSAAGFELQIDTPEPADLKIEADADALLQVFINLVDNAVKFAAGAAVKKIEISALRRGEKVLLGVRDFGPGIAADQRRRVFQRFYRVDNSPTREAAGTGIGLALVQELCSAMGAEVRVADAAPGARFTLHFSQTA